MIREFVITEVMLDRVSGDVSGIVTVDQWTGVVESIEYERFDFFCDATDNKTTLDRSQRQRAEAIVRRTLEADSELSDSSEPFLASAAHLRSPTTAMMSESQKVLADYLENIRRLETAAERTSDAGTSIPFRRLG